MILSDVKRYLSKNTRMTLADLSLHFDTEPDAMRGMLENWIRKGKVRKHDAGDGCGNGCAKCDNATGLEIYEWVG